MSGIIALNLRNDTGSQDIAKEDIGIAGQRFNAFLNPGATGIVQSDDRGSNRHGFIHDLIEQTVDINQSR